MATYSIGASYMIYSYDGTFPDATVGNFGSGGDWQRVGSMIPIYPSGDHLEFYNRGAYISPSHPVPDDIVWAYMAAGGGEHLYIGVVSSYRYDPGPGYELPDSLQIRLYAEPDIETIPYRTTTIGLYAAESLNYLYFMYSESTRGTYLCAFGQITGESTPVSYSEFVAYIESHPYTSGYGAGMVFPVTTQNGNNPENNIAPDSSFPDGGNGDYDNDSDPIPFPSLPTLGAVNSGFLTIFNPSIQELRDIGSFLWSEASSVWNNIMQYQSSAFDLIVSLSVVPVTPPISGNIPLKIGGVSTGVSCAPVTSQYMSFDCGTFDVNEYYGNALDYGAYTKIWCMLPFCGVHELKTDEVMDGSLSIRYNIDLVTGDCVACLLCNRHGLNSVLYQFDGNMSMQIPLTGRDFATYYGNIASGALGIGAGLATGNISGAVGSAMSIMMSKPQVHHAGNLSNNHGFLGVTTPYLIIERPIQSYPANANAFYGYPCNQTKKLGDLSGYTEVEASVLNIPCTDDEVALIREKLSDGVIL